jgi:RimJ/RimL family protein N-acetyltransferase
MTSSIVVSMLGPDDWNRFRDIRLRSLLANPEAFGGKFSEESVMPESHWRAELTKSDALIATTGGVDAAVMYVEVLDGDHGATCWIGGCWSDPAFRGLGAFRSLFDYLDSHTHQKDWARQGLGVWSDNYQAIGAYQKLGFEFAGDLMPSESQPGMFYAHMVRNSPQG